jgi:PEP-CTERM motif-containing protein
MSTRTVRLAVAATLLGASTMAQAVSISIGGCIDPTVPSSGLTTCQAGATVVTFNSGLMPANYASTAGAGGKVVSGSLSGQYAQPGGPASDLTPYLTVPAPGVVNNGTVTATLSTSYNYFGLYWGSMDAYNTLSFLNGGHPVYSVTGAGVISSGTTLGNQTALGSNNYVNFNFGNLAYDEVMFSSNGFAFESDNHAYAKVPEPGTLGLLGLSLLGAAAARRRKAR